MPRAFGAPAVACALAAGITACGLTRPPQGIPRTPAPQPVAPPAAAAPARWIVSAPRDTAHFIIDTRATIAARADSMLQADTLTTQTALRAIPRGAALDVTVTRYSVRVGAGAARVTDTPFRAVGRYNAAGGVVFDISASATCGNIAAAALEATRELWVRWPADVGVGDRWRDSATVSICRDGVPLTLTIAREYRVAAITGDSARAVARLERQSRIALTGRGAIRGDSTQITGEGSGTSTLYVELAAGWVRDGTATTSLRLRARDARRTQQVDQTAQLTFRRAR